MKIQQLQPATCGGIGKTFGKVIAEEKIDGHRGLMHVGGGLDRMYLTGRGLSVKTGEMVERGLNVPHLNAVHETYMNQKLGYTVFDGEVVMLGQPFEHVQSVMGALPESAVDFQMKNGPMTYRAFDLLFFDGFDMRLDSLRNRRAKLGEALQRAAGTCNFDPVACVDEGLDTFYERIVAAGGEGTVEKDLDAVYGAGWRKRKKSMTFDVVVMGFTVGAGKFKAMIGAVVFGAYIDGKLTKVGQCSGMADGAVAWCGGPPNRDGSWIEAFTGPAQEEGTRAWFTLYQKQLLGSVIEVRCNAVTKAGALRHPQFVRVRPDKQPTQCGRPTEQRTSHE